MENTVSLSLSLGIQPVNIWLIISFGHRVSVMRRRDDGGRSLLRGI
jgi:hypothetical protein